MTTHLVTANHEWFTAKRTARPGDTIDVALEGRRVGDAIRYTVGEYRTLTGPTHIPAAEPEETK